jgi:hypothetical protein
VLNARATALTAQLTADDLIVDQALQDLQDDRLNHVEIAARVADLVSVAETPANVALFAPWGAGKSSFGGLLDAELKRRRADAKVITYNAWTYGGESLQRNFIASAARGLGLEPDTDQGQPFFGGLYEKNKGARLKLSRKALQPVLGLALLWMAAILLLLTSATAVLASLAGLDVGQEIIALVPQILPSAGVASLIAALVQVGITNARVEVEQGAPTQEQLRETFSKLVNQETRSGLHPDRPGRLVFFVDELDRCDKDSIVEVLRSIRGFFGEDKCVFVVAADRRVLEEALERLPQSTPVDEENPYYSSASEFFDKVFQFQLSLPPLRGGRLTRFAHDLVGTRSRGVWGELRAQPDGDRLLSLVIHDVIPSHVRSPRRVKILLNNLATNIRVAEARGISWIERAREIAKLTALQTEFPLFAVDLFVEPRLPTLVLSQPENPSARMQALLARHRLPPARGAVNAPPAEGAASGDEEDSDVARPQLAATDATPDVAADADRDALYLSQRRLLASYLARVQDVADPRRDLLYLAPAGAIVDLADPGLAVELEDLAVDSPERAIALLEGQPAEELAKAVRLLGEQGQQEYGLERLSVISTMLAAASEAGFQIDDAYAEAINLLAVTIREEGLLPEHLVRALVIADAGATGAGVASAVLGDDRLLATPERTVELATLAHLLTDPHRKLVFGSLAAGLEDDLSLFEEPAKVLPAPAVTELIEASVQAIRAIAEGSDDDDEVEELAAAVIDPLTARSDVDHRTLWKVVGAVADSTNPVAYPALKARAPGLLETLPTAYAEWLRLRLIAIAPANERFTWASDLESAPPAGISNFHLAAGSATAAVFRDTDGADAGADPEPVIRAMLPHLGQSPAKAWALMEKEVTEALARPYAADRQGSQLSVDRAALLVAGLGEDVREAIAPLVTDDLSRPLQARGTFTAGVSGISAVAPALAHTQRSSLANAIASSPFAAVYPLEVMAARSTLAAAAYLDSDPDADAIRPTLAEILGVGVTEEIAVSWLDSNPAEGDVVALLPQANSPSTRQAFTRWAERHDPAVRTSSVLTLLQKDEALGVAALHSLAGDLDEPAFIDAILEGLRFARTADDRKTLVKQLAAARIDSVEGNRKAVEVVEYLLSLRQKVDDELARLTMPSVGRGHGSRERLERAIKVRGIDIDDRWRRAMESAGLRTPKKKSIFRKR